MSAGRLGGQSVAIAVESTYGSPDAADHALVDTSALAFNAVNQFFKFFFNAMNLCFLSLKHPFKRPDLFFNR